MSSATQSVSQPEPYVFMGGTFDPIHNGHLRTALELQQWLAVEQVHLLPSKQPVHRESPGCNAQQRLAMVEQAVADEPCLAADAREILSAQPSYSLLTVQQLRAERGPRSPVCMVMGVDAYLGLPGWYHWRELLDFCHIIVVRRPGYPFAPAAELAEFTEQHIADTPQQLLSSPAGRVLMHELTPLAISATQIRELVGQGRSARYLLPDPVWHYIQEHRLYDLNQGG